LRDSVLVVLPVLRQIPIEHKKSRHLSGAGNSAHGCYLKWDASMAEEPGPGCGLDQQRNAARKVGGIHQHVSTSSGSVGCYAGTPFPDVG